MVVGSGWSVEQFLQSLCGDEDALGLVWGWGMVVDGYGIVMGVK